MPKKKFLLFLLLAAVAIFTTFLVVLSSRSRLPKTPLPKKSASPTPSPSPTPTPTPKPLTFAEMNALYGPCVFLPVMMYHHIQPLDEAKASGQSALTVTTEFFEKQMKYLNDKGYHVVSITSLTDFFQNGTGLPKKSIVITFDDGYADFYTNALPILRQYGYPATLFIPTGLMNNPGYLSWNQISEAAGSGIYVANHTWSHKNVMMAKEKILYEIATADTQLSERGFNQSKIFAYPYGLESNNAEKILTDLKYNLAFTTNSGSTQCKKQKFDLRRIRVGNTALSAYGF